MKCKFCGSDMELDDVDMWWNRKDMYWICNKCNASAVVVMSPAETFTTWKKDEKS